MSHKSGQYLTLRSSKSGSKTDKEISNYLKYQFFSTFPLVCQARNPLILCTGFSEQIDENRAKEMGLRAFVMKPIVMSEIARTIREVLDET